MTFEEYIKDKVKKAKTKEEKTQVVYECLAYYPSVISITDKDLAKCIRRLKCKKA